MSLSHIINYVLIHASKVMGFVARLLYPVNSEPSLRYYSDLINTYRIRHTFQTFGRNSLVSKLRRLDGAEGISIGDNSFVAAQCVLSCWKGVNPNAEIIIGNGCSIGEFTHISSCDKITIGDGVLIGRFVYISDNNHGSYSSSSQDIADQLIIPPHQRPIGIKGPIIIGNNVWIGDKVSILSGVTIGDSSVIAANSVVTHDVPPRSIVGGIPMRILKQF